MRLSRSTAGPAALLVATLALAACGSTEAPTTASSTTPAPTSAEAAGPVTYTDERGEHTLEEPADAVVSLEWGLTENLLALGANIVGQADVEGYNTWAQAMPLDAETPDVGTRGEASLEAINALEPDLIAVTTDTAETVIGQLEDIAPVVVLRGSDGSDPIGYMRSTVETLATVTGTTDKGAELLAGFDAKVTEAKAALAEAGAEGASFTMADGWIANGTTSIRMYTSGSFFGALGDELGLVNAWPGEGDPNYGLETIDVEGLTVLADTENLHFVYASNGGAEADPFATGLKDNAIWEQLPFVVAGDVHRLPDGIWMFGGPASAGKYIDALVAALTA
ncbi:ABC transporter substrate-binding protein [Flavimobilis marinus]|uniref:Iron complex transport system substrate-binding protein n=1 Tax=Flavimobilis marinus TaxID=285351 RepID=A0A1I2G183_9MICO|nr:iron-siderophore ABC transporter substrate-binding protein [Flavimobilis marinus]GHG50546.1 ABC transporter substrate-binding protein [Flavimobilis marinus]SFF10888.1 iron complex transport system substrate-binding protein [Flavimobilis marinus]